MPTSSSTHFRGETRALLQRYGAPPFDFAADAIDIASPRDGFEWTFLNALSIPLPLGEKFFIATIKACLDAFDLPPATKEEARIFMVQESLHLRQHIDYNRTLCTRRSYKLDKLEFPVKFNFEEVARTQPLHHRLAMTVCLEHVTTILAEAILRHPEWIRQGSDSFQQLWNWHALEEIDHRSFAFELYVARGFELRYLHEVMRDFVPRLVRFLEAIFLGMATSDGHGVGAARRWFRQSPFLFAQDGPRDFFADRLACFYEEDFHPEAHVGFGFLT